MPGLTNGIKTAAETTHRHALIFEMAGILSLKMTV